MNKKLAYTPEEMMICTAARLIQIKRRVLSGTEYLRL